MTTTPLLRRLHARSWPIQQAELYALFEELGGATHPLNRAALEELSHGGRRVRALLPGACLHALAPDAGPNAVRAARWLGLALELVHLGTLCHDDLMDGDCSRRGFPSAWQRLGAAQAITLGDYLFFVAQEAVLRAPLGCAAKLAAVRDLTGAAQRVARGQALEDSLRADGVLPTRVDYREIACGKTGALLAAALRFGGLCADSTCLAELDALGLEVGFAYQLADDLDDVEADLWEGKPSWLAAHAPLDPRALYREPKSPADVAALLQVIARSGSVEAGRHTLGAVIAGVSSAARRIAPELAQVIAQVFVVTPTREVSDACA